MQGVAALPAWRRPRMPLSLGVFWLLGVTVASSDGKCRSCAGFAPVQMGGHTRRLSHTPSPLSLSKTSTPLGVITATKVKAKCSNVRTYIDVSTRGEFVTHTTASLLVGALSLVTITPPRMVQAAESSTDNPSTETNPVAPRRWISGKSEKPRGSKDRTGTKRDSNYLRCLSDCTTECRKPGQGPSKDNAECLEACQDYCCKTYEQCTYTQNYEG